MGSFPSDRSPFGVLDMAGNVFEITGSIESKYDKSWTSPLNYRVARGSPWISKDASLVRATFRSGFHPTNRNSLVGFRCAR